MRLILGFIFLLLLFNGCSSNNNSVKKSQIKKSYGYSFTQGTVLGFLGDKVIMSVNNNTETNNSSYQYRLADKIIKNSLFITGMETFIGKEKAYITDVRKNEVTFKIANSKLKLTEKVKIYIPKKTIAIMDFTLNSVNNEKESFQLDDMTTRIVQNGQYIVVEREKLDLILKEQKLADSGLLNTNTASKIGKLVSADIILTGTFTEQGDYWSINARLIDVSTSIILVAINEKISLNEFKPKNPKNENTQSRSFTFTMPKPTEYNTDSNKRRLPPPPGPGRRPPPPRF